MPGGPAGSNQVLPAAGLQQHRHGPGLPGLKQHCTHPPFAAPPGTQAPATDSRPAMGAARSSSRKAVATRLYVSMVGLLRPRSILLISDWAMPECSASSFWLQRIECRRSMSWLMRRYLSWRARRSRTATGTAAAASLSMSSRRPSKSPDVLRAMTPGYEPLLISTTSGHLAALALPPGRQPLPRLGDLALLPPPAARVLPFVVAAQQQHNLIAVGMTEDPQQQAIFTQPELEQPLTELFPERRAADIDPLLLQDLTQRGTEHSTLASVEFPDPFKAWLAASIVFIELGTTPHRSKNEPATDRWPTRSARGRGDLVPPGTEAARVRAQI